MPSPQRYPTMEIGAPINHRVSLTPTYPAMRIYRLSRMTNAMSYTSFTSPATDAMSFWAQLSSSASLTRKALSDGPTINLRLAMRTGTF
jgi:hypothetical protein